MKRERSPALTSAMCRACNPVARGAKKLATRAPAPAADRDDSVMGTASFEWEDQEICNGTVNLDPYPELGTSIIMHIAGTATNTRGTMDPMLSTVDLVTMLGVETVAPLNLTDAPAGLCFEALVVGMPSSVCYRGRDSMDVKFKAKLTSAALTSTWPLRPGRAWNPRRRKQNLSRAHMATHHGKVNGCAEKAKVSNGIPIQVYLAYRRMNVGVVPIVNVTGPFTPSHMAYAAIANWDLKLGVWVKSVNKLERTPSATRGKPRRGLALTSPAPPRQRRACNPAALAGSRGM